MKLTKKELTRQCSSILNSYNPGDTLNDENFAFIFNVFQAHPSKEFILAMLGSPPTYITVDYYSSGKNQNLCFWLNGSHPFSYIKSVQGTYNNGNNKLINLVQFHHKEEVWRTPIIISEYDCEYKYDKQHKNDMKKDWICTCQDLLTVIRQLKYKDGYIFYRLEEAQPPGYVWQWYAKLRGLSLSWHETQYSNPDRYTQHLKELKEHVHMLQRIYVARKVNKTKAV